MFYRYNTSEGSGHKNYLCLIMVASQRNDDIPTQNQVNSLFYEVNSKREKTS